jgi:hypothetical protein
MVIVICCFAAIALTDRIIVARRCFRRWQARYIEIRRFEEQKRLRKETIEEMLFGPKKDWRIINI